jgi:hypothetical protein
MLSSRPRRDLRVLPELLLLESLLALPAVLPFSRGTYVMGYGGGEAGGTATGRALPLLSS